VVKNNSDISLKSSRLLIYGLFSITIIGIVYLLEVFDLRESILNMPAPDGLSDEPPSCQGVRMSQIDCFFRVIIPSQSNFLTSFLVLRNSQELIMAVYFLCGMFGCSIYFFVLMYKPGYMGIPKAYLENELKQNTVLMRFFLAGLTGVLSFLMIWAAANGLGSILPSAEGVKKNPSMQNFYIIPVLSGLFLSIFFDGARQILKRFFAKKEGS